LAGGGGGIINPGGIGGGGIKPIGIGIGGICMGIFIIIIGGGGGIIGIDIGIIGMPKPPIGGNDIGIDMDIDSGRETGRGV